MAQAKVLVIGSSNTDMVARVSRIPMPGETLLGGDLKIVAGGKGANQAVAAAKLGAKVTFVACIGCDPFGDQSVIRFEELGMDTHFIVRDEISPSGVALITVDDKGENAIVVAPGSNSKLTPEHARQAESAIADSDVVLAQLEIPLETVQAAAELAKEHGKRFILNPAPAMSLPHSLLALVDILTPNEHEAKILSQSETYQPEEWAKSLHNRTGGAVIVTLGGDGVLIEEGEEPKRFLAPPVSPVDTTAAGDAFAGALAVGVAEGRSLEDAAQFAQKAAALSVTRMGAQPSMPIREEVDLF